MRGSIRIDIFEYLRDARLNAQGLRHDHAADPEVDIPKGPADITDEQTHLE